MRNYYYLTSALPQIEVGVPPELSLHELWHLLNENLNEHDREQVKCVRRYWDVQNLRLMWEKEELDPVGFYSEAGLEEALLTEELPDYICDFDAQYTEVEEKLSHFPQLVTRFFTAEIERLTGFLKDYLSFEREWRLVMLGFRAKKTGKTLAHELRYEDPGDDIVAQLMAQKDAKSFEPPDGYEDLKPLFENRQDSPLALHRALSDYRFQRIADLHEGEIFSFKRVLGYLVQLIIVEKWQELDKQKGQTIVDEILNSRPHTPKERW